MKKNKTDNRIINFSIHADIQLSGIEKIDWLLCDILELEKISDTVYQANFKSQNGQIFQVLYLLNRIPGNDEFINMGLIEINLRDDNIDPQKLTGETDVVFAPAVINQRYTEMDNKKNSFHPLYMEENQIKEQAQIMDRRSKNIKWQRMNRDIFIC